MVDYHLHTRRCCHAEGSMSQYLSAAEEKELKEIGFADHFPLELIGYEPRSQVTMMAAELDEYIKDVELVKHNSKNVVVKLGVEVDYFPGKEKVIEKLLLDHNFDYVIGSIHFLDDWDFTHPSYANDYKNKNLEDIYYRYFDLVKMAVGSGLFDYIGHIDIVKKFGYQPDIDFSDLYRDLARLLRIKKTGLELNTAGKDAPVGSFYPAGELLEIALDEGVDLTLGSDAHSPEQVARYFPEAIAQLSALGCSEVSTYSNRVPAKISLS